MDVVDQILFDSGSATLSGRGGEVLERVGAVLAQLEDRQIQVSGHTDDSPITDRLQATFPTNWELSVTRAVNVVRFLTEHAHVRAKHLVASGYAATQPVSSNASPQGRARNRRIEILLMPAVGGKAVLAKAEGPAVASAALTGTKKEVPGGKRGVSAVSGKRAPAARLVTASAKKAKVTK